MRALGLGVLAVASGCTLLLTTSDLAGSGDASDAATASEAPDGTVSEDAPHAPGADGGDASDAATSYRDLVMGDGPLVYWRMNIANGTSIPDETGSRNALLLQGSGYALGEPGAIAGDSDRAVRFVGADGFGLVSDPRALDFAGRVPFTFECWARHDGPVDAGAEYQHLVSASPSSPTRNGYLLWIHPMPYGTTPPEILFEVDGTGTGGFPSSQPGLGGRYVHYVAVYDGSFASLYVDGVLADSQATSAAMSARSTDVTIASWYGGNFFVGAIDEVAFYAKALGASAIARHHAFGIGRQNWP